VWSRSSNALAGTIGIARSRALVSFDAPGASKLTKARDLAIPMVPAAEFEILLDTGSWRTVLT
jgi:hypothetical protein